MVTIFILLLVAEYQIKIANSKLREVLRGTDCKRQRMKRKKKTISQPLSIEHWWEKCRREVDILHLYYWNFALNSRKAFWLTTLRSSIIAAVLKRWSQQHQHHLRTCSKCKFSDLVTDQEIRNLETEPQQNVFQQTFCHVLL